MARLAADPGKQSAAQRAASSALLSIPPQPQFLPPLAQRSSLPCAHPDKSSAAVAQRTASVASEPVHAAINRSQSESPSLPAPRGPGGRPRTQTTRSHRPCLRVCSVRNETKARIPPAVPGQHTASKSAQDPLRKRTHRGLRSLLSRAYSHDHRREARRLRRQQYRRDRRAQRSVSQQEWLRISELSLAKQLEQDSSMEEACK